MNELVRKLVPVNQLPDDLRADFDPEGCVEIDGPSRRTEERPDLLQIVRDYRRLHPRRFRSPDEVVPYVRAVRDGGDLEPWLGPCSTSTQTS
jgi:hypothetical protein